MYIKNNLFKLTILLLLMACNPDCTSKHCSEMCGSDGVQSFDWAAGTCVCKKAHGLLGG